MKKRGYQKRMGNRYNRKENSWDRWVSSGQHDDDMAGMTDPDLNDGLSEEQINSIQYKEMMKPPKKNKPKSAGISDLMERRRMLEDRIEKENQQKLNELSKVQRFVRKSDDFGDVIDWNWNGDMLEIMTMNGVERYSRKDLKDARVFNRRSQNKTRKFDGKEYYNDGFTYSNNKADAQRVANRLRKTGNNARVVKTKYGYSIYQRPKQTRIKAIVIENPDGSIYSATPYTSDKQKQVAINNAKAFKNRITGAYGGQSLAIMDGTIKTDNFGNWVSHKTRGRPYNFATPNMAVGMQTPKKQRRRRR